MIKIFHRLHSKCSFTSQIKDPQDGGELRISLVQELVGTPLPEAHPAVGPAGRQEGPAGVRRQT